MSLYGPTFNSAPIDLRNKFQCNIYIYIYIYICMCVCVCVCVCVWKLIRLSEHTNLNSNLTYFKHNRYIDNNNHDLQEQTQLK